MRNKHLVYIGIVLTGLTAFFLLSGLHHTGSSLVLADETEPKPELSLDSLQPYLDQYSDLIRRFEEANEADLPKVLREKQEKESQIQNLTRLLSGSKKLTFKGVDYLIFVATPDEHQIQLHWKNPATDNKLVNIANAIASPAFHENAPLMIMNAGMYDPQNNPIALYIENGMELKSLNTSEKNDGTNFHLLPNGVFYIDKGNKPHIKTTPEFKSLYKKGVSDIQLATQSGPMLVINRGLHDKFRNHSTNLNIRNGVGVMSGDKVVFAISVGLVNFYDFGSLFKDVFACPNALYLDGAISRMYLKDLNPNEKGGNFGPMVSVVGNPN